MKEIRKAARWAKSTTFTAFYIRDSLSLSPLLFILNYYKHEHAQSEVPPSSLHSDRKIFLMTDKGMAHMGSWERAQQWYHTAAKVLPAFIFLTLLET